MSVNADPFLSLIPEQEQNVFLEQLQTRSFSKGEHYVREGQYINTIAFIQEGFIRTYQIDYQGNDTTLEFHEPHSFCGSYYGFYTHQPALDNLVAITDCRLGLITYEQLMSFYEKSINFNIFGRKIIEQVCINKDLRLSIMLQSDAEERYRWFMDKHSELLQVAQLRHIASYLGIQPETLSRIRRKIAS